jgi:hypothetical protein
VRFVLFVVEYCLEWALSGPGEGLKIFNHESNESHESETGRRVGAAGWLRRDLCRPVFKSSFFGLHS